MARNIYRVVPDGNQWKVKKDSVVRSTHATKQPAIDAGRVLALANQPSQLVVHRANGTIELEWTYGNDPYPPKG